MKIYKKRKQNAMYLLHNYQRVGDLKEGMEIMVSTDDTPYFTSGWVKNIYKENFPIDNLVPLVKTVDDNTFGTPIEWLEHVTRLDNIIGNSKLDFKVINGVKCIILTLSGYMVKNLKEMYNENDYIVFDNLTLTLRDIEKDDNGIEAIENKKICAIVTKAITVPSNDEIIAWYEDVVEIILARENIINTLASVDQKFFSIDGRVWSKQNCEDELQALVSFIPFLKDSEDKVSALDTFFKTFENTPIMLVRNLLEMEHKKFPCNFKTEPRYFTTIFS